MKTRTPRIALAALTITLSLGSVLLLPRPAAAAAWFNCQANAVYEVNIGGVAQLQVSCNNEYQPGVNFIAIRTDAYSDAQEARFVSMASSAILGGRRFRVFMTDTNCPGLTNCKLANAWALYTP